MVLTVWDGHRAYHHFCTKGASFLRDSYLLTRAIDGIHHSHIAFGGMQYITRQS